MGKKIAVEGGVKAIIPQKFKMNESPALIVLLLLFLGLQCNLLFFLFIFSRAHLLKARYFVYKLLKIFFFKFILSRGFLGLPIISATVSTSFLRFYSLSFVSLRFASPSSLVYCFFLFCFGPGKFFWIWLTESEKFEEQHKKSCQIWRKCWRSFNLRW